MSQHKALGRGVHALFSPEVIKEVKAEESNNILHLAIEKITTNRRQPRLNFKKEPLESLSESIKKDGLLQPLVIRDLGDDRYELVAGERRLRASKMAGLTKVPVFIQDISEERLLELALVENIQRENLDPIEEALGYHHLMVELKLTQAEIAQKVSKSREYVANSIRLLKLPKQIQNDVAERKITPGHARALLALTNIQDQLKFREKILSETLSVRDIEKMLRERVTREKNRTNSRKKDLSPTIKLLLDEIQKALGTRAHIQMKGKEERGQLLIEFFSIQDLDRIYRTIAKRATT